MHFIRVVDRMDRFLQIVASLNFDPKSTASDTCYWSADTLGTKALK